MLLFRKPFLSMLLLALACGCRVGPKYHPPILEAPSEWKQGGDTCDSQNVFRGLWWEVFEDEQLNCLEQQAVISNPNLFVALDRVAQARAIVGVDAAALYPQINLNPSYTNTGQLFKIYLPNGGSFLPQSFPQVYRIHQLQYTMPFNMSYEIDLWGKLRDQYDSAIFSAQMQEENLQVALLTVTTDLASSYFLMRSLDALIEVTLDNLNYLNTNVGLVTSRFNKGLIGELDVVSAKQQLADNEALYYDTLRQRRLHENAIATLIGLPSPLFCLESMPLRELPPPVKANLPSEVLLQRPDLRAAERSMAAQHALIGVAYASFFPSVELTGILGFFSPDLKNFMTWKSRLWSLGVNAAQPIFDGGYNLANLKLTRAEFQETLHDYQQKVLTAFQEVEDALVNIQLQAMEYDRYLVSSEFAQKRIQLSTSRYTKGFSNYLDVLDSERSKIQTDINRANVLGQYYLSTVQLIKALGGNWSFSLQLPFEEPRSSCEGEEDDDSSGPSVTDDNICRHIF